MSVDALSIRCRFDLPQQYQLGRQIGTGTYGTVREALYKPTQTMVAIKKTQCSRRSTSFATLRELCILRHFSSPEARHPNIIHLRDVFFPVCCSEWLDVYFVLELMPLTLKKAIAEADLSCEHYKFILSQIFSAMVALHAIGIVHRDLKPSNILINYDCEIKICDFGISRPLAHSSLMTQYVTTRWYRAPEILCRVIKYSEAIDIWAIGCIFAEMATKRVLFPGKDYKNQVDVILDVLAVSPGEVDQVLGPGSVAILGYGSADKKKPWEEIVPKLPNSGYKLLKGLLAFDPRHRVTAQEALEHEFVEEYYDPDECFQHNPISNEYLHLENHKEDLSTGQLRSIISKAIEGTSLIGNNGYDLTEYNREIDYTGT